MPPLQPFSTASISLGVFIASTLVARGRKRKSLSSSGGAAAWLVGFSSVACGYRGFLLVLFYQVGSSATKYQARIKERHDAAASLASERGASQVLGCSLFAVICALTHAFQCGEEKPIDFDQHPLASQLSLAIVAHYATCCGDTLASELGMLSSPAHPPRLILPPFKIVPRGTNGGVTLWGTTCSALGGLIIGLGMLLLDTLSGVLSYSHIASPYAATTLLYAATSGVLGSTLDSILGATLQATFYDKDTKLVHTAHDGTKRATGTHVQLVAGRDVLTNVHVNLISVLLCMFLGGRYLGPYLFTHVR